MGLPGARPQAQRFDSQHFITLASVQPPQLFPRQQVSYFKENLVYLLACKLQSKHVSNEMARTLTLLKIYILLFSGGCYEDFILVVKVHSLYKLLELNISVGGFVFCFFHGRGKYTGYKTVKMIRCLVLPLRICCGMLCRNTV